MKKIGSLIINSLPLIINFVFVIGAIFIINYFYPKQIGFIFKYEKGKVWKYDDLYAPIDFPIYKTEFQIAQEKKALIKDLPSFFYRDTLLEDKNIEGVKKALDIAIKDSVVIVKPSEKDDIIRNLSEVYTNGIIRKTVNQNLDEKINLLNKNESETKKLSEFYNMKNAFKEVVSDEMKNSTHLLKIINNFLEPNIKIDKVTREKQIESLFSNISFTKGGYNAGQKIVANNEIISSEKYNIIKSLDKTFREKVDNTANPIFNRIGYNLLSVILFILYLSFLYNIDPDILRSTRKLFFLISLTVGFLALAYFNTETTLASKYLIPFAIIPILVRLFFGFKTAFLTITVVMFFTALIVPFDIEYIIINFTVCYFALLVNINAFYGSRFFIGTLLIIAVFIATFYAFELTKVEHINLINLSEAKWLAVNGLLSLFSYFFVPFFERIFGFTSNFSLLELNNVNSNILKKMQTEAPGSFAHSLQVGNLAEAAATAIGANPLLVKVGALYHDIGKINNPLFFIENQNSNYNPHDNLEPEESAKIIIDHVLEGIEMAKKQRLPDTVIDFIRTHHGTQRLEVFWNRHLDSTNEVDLDLLQDEKFKYPGPLPYNKETAILMLADTCEAACKSIKNHTSEAIEEMVNRVTAQKIKNNQFANSNISFKEITLIKKVFIKMLKSIYHVRVSYTD